MSLQEEIDARRKEIHTESYPMSIGELMSLYTGGEMDIHPEFQRFFRWTPIQKSKLIESILLGIPIPPVFVSQRDNGIWDVIDGLQRLSTIFEFAGILKDEHDKLLPASKLLATEYLPMLENKYWHNEENEVSSFTQVQRLLFKRARFDVSIIQKESDPDTKFELFQRLNTGGTKLEDQEIRNCILVMINPGFYKWLKGISSHHNFQLCLPLTDRAKEEQYDVELALRFFVYKNSTVQEINTIKDIGDFITVKMIQFARQQNFDLKIESEIFEQTFNLLAGQLGENAFKKYFHEKDIFLGAFSISAFEVIATGIGKNIQKDSIIRDNNELINRIKNVWLNKTFIQRSGSGTRASTRLPYFIPLGEEIFSL